MAHLGTRCAQQHAGELLPAVARNPIQVEMPRALSVEIQRRLKPEAQEAQFLDRFKNAIAPTLPELAASVLRRARAGDAFAVWKANAQTESALVRWMHCVCSSEASDDILERLAGQLE